MSTASTPAAGGSASFKLLPASLQELAAPAEQAPFLSCMTRAEAERRLPVFSAADFEALSGEQVSYAVPSWRFDHMITTAAELRAAVRDLGKRLVLAVDTETALAAEKEAALREAGCALSGDLSARLCLIQIGYPHQRRVHGRLRIEPEKPGRNYLIDVLALSAEAERLSAETGESVNPLAPLAELLGGGRHVLLIQNASFERKQFAKYGLALSGVEDTIALARAFRPDLPAFNLAALALELCGIAVDKEQQKSVWSTRPLSPEQTRYALLDTEITFRVWSALTRCFARAERDTEEVRRSADVERMLGALQALEWQRIQLLEDAGIRGLEAELRARAAKYKQVLRREILPRLHRQLQEQRGESFDAAEGYYYRGLFGAAYYRPQRIRHLDEERLGQIDPALPALLRRPCTTEKEVKAAVDSLHAEGRCKGVTAAAVWKAIREDAGRGEPRLKVTLADAPAEEDFTRLVECVAVPEDWSVADYLRNIMEAEIGRARLLRLTGAGNELALIELKKRLICDSLLEELIERGRGADGAAAPEAAAATGAGEASYKTSSLRRTDYSRFRTRFPEVYERAVAFLPPSREAVEQALQERGFDAQWREELLNELFVDGGELGRLEARIYPAYARYYKGVEEPEDALEQDALEVQ